MHGKPHNFLIFVTADVVQFLQNSPVPSHIIVFVLLSRPLYNIISPLFSPSPLSDTQQQRSLAIATDGTFSCLCTYVCGSDDQEERCIFFPKQLLSLAATKSVPGTQQQRYNGSRIPSSRLCASSHGHVCGWCTAAGDRTTIMLH